MANIARCGPFPRSPPKAAGRDWWRWPAAGPFQAREREGQAAEGFVTLFGVKVFLPVVADRPHPRAHQRTGGTQWLLVQLAEDGR